jgi:3-deoxy-D-manno-octulosonic-acid transferase
VIDELLRRRPDTSIVFTTTTVTGQAQARRLFPQATVTYFPLDFTRSVRRFLDHHRPRVFGTMETEIWPNVTRLARARGIRLILANGRISDRSFPRYRAVRRVVGPILQNYSRILAREPIDRERFLSIGAPESIVETIGNVKFDFEPDLRPLEIAAELITLIAGRNVLVLGSTMQGEDEMLIPAIEPLVREGATLVVIAPRKGERFNAVAALLRERGMATVRRSEWTAGSVPPAAQVLLLDTFGDLARIYRHAGAAFIGGSLVPTGGHNPIEAAVAGVPVSFGPHMSNFREISSAFLRAGAAEEVRSADDVVRFARRMFTDPAEHLRRTGAARATVEQNRGASAHTAKRMIELLS